MVEYPMGAHLVLLVAINFATSSQDGGVAPKLSQPVDSLTQKNLVTDRDVKKTKEGLQLGKGGSITRELQAGPWVEMEIELRLQPGSVARLWFRMDDGATDNFVEWSASDDGEYRLRIVDTLLDQKTGKVLEDEIKVPEPTIASKRYTMSYRYGLIEVRAGGEVVAIGYIHNRGAAVRGFAIECVREQALLRSLSDRGIPRLRPLTPQQEVKVAEAIKLERGSIPFFEAGKFREAIESWERIVQLRKELRGEYARSTARSLNTLAFLYSEASQHKNAEKLYNGVVRVERELYGPYHPECCSGLVSLADLYCDTSRFKQAETCLLPLRDALVRLHGRKHLQVARVQINLARALQGQERFTQAEDLFREVLETRKSLVGEKHRDVAATLNNFGNLKLTQGDLKSALDFVRQALQIRSEILPRKHPDLANTQNSLGAIYRDLGDLKQSGQCYEEARRIWRSVNGRLTKEYAAVAENLGNLCYDLDDSHNAVRYLREAIEIREKLFGRDHPACALSIANLAGVYTKLGDFAQAENLLRDAKQIRENKKQTDTASYAGLLNNLGGVMVNTGRRAEAKVLFARALEIRRRRLGSRHPDTAQTLGNLARIWESEGELDRAMQAKVEALEVLEKFLGPRSAKCVIALSDLGATSLSRGKPVEADLYYQKALTLADDCLGKKHTQYAYALIGLAQVALHTGKPKEAIASLGEAYKVLTHNREITFQMQSERQQLLLKTKSEPHLSQLLSLYLDEGAAKESLELIMDWKGASTVHQRRSRIAAESNGGRALLAEQRTLAAKRFAVLRNPPRPEGKSDAVFTEQRNHWEKRVAALAAEQERLEEKLAGINAGVQTQATSVSDLAKALPDGTALVDYFSFRYSRPDPEKIGHKKYTPLIVAHVLKSDGTVSVHRIGKSARVRELVLAWRKELGGSPKSASAANELYELLWRPVRRRLDGVDTVAISSDGILAKLPFPALPSASGEYLIEKYRFAHVPVPQLLPTLNEKRSRKAGDFLIVGNPDYQAKAGVVAEKTKRPRRRAGGPNLEFRELPETGVEVNEMNRLYRELFEAEKGVVETLQGAEATEANLRNRVGRFENLHIATHGYFAPQSLAGSGDFPTRMISPGLLSGLAMAGANRDSSDVKEDDGILTAEEISTLSLGNTNLVVLSACETALGKESEDEGLIGIQRAFMVAGARSTISTLWKVDDTATRKLMLRFYRNYWEHGMKPIEALRAAQLHLLRNPAETRGEPIELKAGNAKPAAKRRSPPAAWAAFQLSGDWR